MRSKTVDIGELVKEYMKSSKLINQSHEALLNCKRGFFNRKLKVQLNIAIKEHKQYSHLLEGLDEDFVGDLEIYMHDQLTFLAIKDTNYKVISRARTVCFNSLERFDKTIVSIEDSLNFKKSIMAAWLSIGIAVLSIVVSCFGS